ncbi:MAG: MFS transporter [Acidimicrobiia bacterium]
MAHKYARRTVARLITRHPASAEDIASVFDVLSHPRDDVVAEQIESSTGDVAVFSAVHGPFRSYRRTVTRAADQVVEQFDYDLAIPYLSWLYALPIRHQLRRRPPNGEEFEQPWWAPPDRLDARASTVLALLAVASLTVGYLNTLLTQTVTFAADEFGSSDGAQTRALAVVRVGIVIALVVVSMADRRGRRSVLLATATAAPIFSALGALAPNLAWLTASQAVGRPLALSLDMIIVIIATEEMPKGCRAHALSLLALSTGFGAGLCVMTLTLADIGAKGWRLSYVFPLVFLFLVRPLARQLTESKRFVAPHATGARMRDHLGRFALLAACGLFINLLIAPASGLQNDYLKDVRGYSGSLVALFTLTTQTPAGIGVLLGGELADRYGRRRVGAVALAFGSILSALTFTVGGWQLWLVSLCGAMIAGAAVPALGVYQTELFPTALRGRAKAGIIVVTLVGSTIGLLVAGAARDSGVSFGRIMTILAIGPVLVAMVVWLFYPETAHTELEELNPEDAL